MKQLLTVPVLLMALWTSAVEVARAATSGAVVAFDLPTEQSTAPKAVLPPIPPPSPAPASQAVAATATDEAAAVGAVSFALPQDAALAPAIRPTTDPLPLSANVASSRDHRDGADLFTGGSNSLVARTVGHAEGTRTADGSKTRAYYGHVDPGNGVWNRGSFSYQHEAKSPEEADEKQLRRLQGQADAIREKAEAHRLSLSLEEELNGIDLANQAPLAALDTPGYVEWLQKARDRGLTESEAVLWARTQSYWNPRLNRWEAPGLGNTEGSINHDQERRQTAIARALESYQQQAMARRREDEPQEKVADKPPQEKVADQIIFQDLSQLRSGELAQARSGGASNDATAAKP